MAKKLPWGSFSHEDLRVDREDDIYQNFPFLNFVGMLMVKINELRIGDNAVRIMGSKMGSTDLKRDMPQWIRHYQDGKLKLDELITDRYPLERINEAVEAVRKGM